jgi:hypothetical protein
MTDLDKIRANEGRYCDHWSNNRDLDEYGLVSAPKPVGLTATRALLGLGVVACVSGVVALVIGLIVVIGWVVT